MCNIQNITQNLDSFLTKTEETTARTMVLSGLIEQVSALFKNKAVSSFFGEIGSILWSLDLIHTAKRWGKRTVTYIRGEELHESGKEIIADICSTARQILDFAERNGLNWGTFASGVGQVPVIGAIAASLRIIGSVVEISHHSIVIAKKVNELKAVQDLQGGKANEGIAKLEKEITNIQIERVQAINSALWGVFTLMGLVAAMSLGPGAVALFGVYFYAVAVFAAFRNKDQNASLPIFNRIQVSQY